MQLSGEVQVSGHALSMAELAKTLHPYARRIIVDKTGLNGVFDVDLKSGGDIRGTANVSMQRQK
jgi:uncharacterized protein (TIGR03435 family)